MRRVTINTMETGRTVEVGAGQQQVQVAVTAADGAEHEATLSVAQAEAYKAALTEAIKYARP